jgi:hypothetical protein
MSVVHFSITLSGVVTGLFTGDYRMREVKKDLWRLAEDIKPDAVCITINGFVKKDGSAVLGRGCALEATIRWPKLPFYLGASLRNLPLRLHDLTAYLEDDGPMYYSLLAFPVKPRQVVVAEDYSNIVKRHRGRFAPGTVAPGCFAIATPELIKKSSRELMHLIERNNWSTVLLPRPGAGNGELSWNDEVKPLIEPILGDRVIIVSK